MDKSKNYIAMMTGRDSKKPCCAPIDGSFVCITWFQTVHPSAKVFMTIGIDVDQYRNYSERELCSSSLSEMLIDQNGRRVGSCPSSFNFKMKLGEIENNNRKIFQTKYPVSHVYQEDQSICHQSCVHLTTLISIAMIKENVLVNASMDKRFK